MSDEDLIEVIAMNTLGLLIYCREVKNESNEVDAQSASRGHMFNIDGAGSDGMPTPRSLHFVIFQLGMVTTDLRMSGAMMKQVTEYLVMKPTYVRFLTGLKAYSQISQLDVGDGEEASLERFYLMLFVEQHKTMLVLPVMRSSLLSSGFAFDALGLKKWIQVNFFGL
ncbi:hypothetical protein C5167_009296 [Papaver somniferum]|uniref:Uncharacterized protein n=1 Tax=Papaver somniferum TaxID=3469 RepID=A0A4Y7K0Y4_PAPSO|nr:hypothetical protein C5167_009296 [Papaver somniferum]